MRRAAILLVAVLISACTPPGPPLAEVTSTMTNRAILPSLHTATETSAELESLVGLLCSQPEDDGLAEARQSWRAAKKAWEAAELVTLFGPAQTLRTLSKVDYPNVDTDSIETLLASQDPVDRDYVDQRASASQRGLGAMEYLLFHEGGAFDDPRRCRLLASVANVVATQVDALEGSWTESWEGGEGFGDTFLAMSPDDALGLIVSSIINTLRQQTELQLGKALGLTAPEPSVDAIPEGPAGFGAGVYRAQLIGVRALLASGEPGSLADLIAARSEPVAREIEEHLRAAIGELEMVEAPLRQTAGQDPGSLRPLYEHLSSLLTLFDSDVVSLLDITLGFSDTDGDTG